MKKFIASENRITPNREWTEEEARTECAQSNATHGYSKKFDVFESKPIILLRDLHEAIPGSCSGLMYRKKGDKMEIHNVVDSIDISQEGNGIFVKGVTNDGNNNTFEFREGRDFEFV